jgi:hypothetical protein
MVPSGLSELWCGIHTNPILRCFDNSKALNYEDLLEGMVPKLGELANGVRLSIEVLRQDQSEVWITVRW